MIDRRGFLALGMSALVRPQQTPSDADRLRDPIRAGKSRLPVGELDNSEQVKGIERQLRCTCGCNLDVFTCRTTDFTCEFSPRMHLDVMRMLKEGKTSEQVIAAFVEKNGEQVLMAPPPVGFNLAGYLVPGFLILLASTILAIVLLRRHRMTAVAAEAVPAADTAPGAHLPSQEELERLKRALSEVAD